MPAIKSAAKRIRTSEKARLRNAPAKSRIRSARRNVLEAITSKEPEKSVVEFRAYCSILDKAAKKGIIKKNTSIRRKRRAAAAIAKLPVIQTS